MAIEIVDLPMKNKVIFHSYVAVYQGVTMIYYTIGGIINFKIK